MNLEFIKVGVNGQLEFDFEALAAITSVKFVDYIKSQMMCYYFKYENLDSEDIILFPSDKYISEIFNIQLEETPYSFIVEIAERWCDIGNEFYSPSAKRYMRYNFRKKSGKFEKEQHVSFGELNKIERFFGGADGR